MKSSRSQHHPNPVLSLVSYSISVTILTNFNQSDFRLNIIGGQCALKDLKYFYTENVFNQMCIPHVFGTKKSTLFSTKYITTYLLDLVVAAWSNLLMSCPKYKDFSNFTLIKRRKYIMLGMLKKILLAGIINNNSVIIF